MLKNRPISELLLFQPNLNQDNWLSELKQKKGETPLKFGEFNTVVELSVAEFEGHIYLFIRDRSVEKDLHDGFKLKLKELQDINTNLENLVIDRTRKISVQKNLLDEIYNNIVEVVILCDLKGNCLTDQPAKTHSFFYPEDLNSRNVADLLFESFEAISPFKSWLELVESESLPFEDLIPLVESSTTIKSKKLNISYRLLDSSPKTIVIILNDRTEYLDLSSNLLKASEDSHFYLNLLKSPERMLHKFIEWEGYLQNLLLNDSSSDQKKAAGILHLLKGSFQLESFYDGYMAAQAIEETRSGIKQEDLLSLLKFIQVKKELLTPHDQHGADPKKLSHMVLKCKKILEKTEHPFSLRILNDMMIPDSISQGLEYIIIQHFRNILAHGFQSLDERIMLDKTPENLVEVDAEVSQGHHVIVISDDGKGLAKGPKASQGMTLMSGTGEGLNGIQIEAKRMNGSASLIESKNKVSLVLTFPTL